MDHLKIHRLSNVPALQSREPLASNEIQELTELARALGFADMHLIETSKIVTAHWVGLKCRYGCANYNTSWCCPPKTPTLEQTRELLAEYELALLLVGRKSNIDFYRQNRAKRRRQIKEWKATVALERKLFNRGYHKAFGMSGEACALCEKCAFPDNCRFPSEKRPSIESCSIDVFKTIESLGRRIHLAKDLAETYYSYSLILLK